MRPGALDASCSSQKPSTALNNSSVVMIVKSPQSPTMQRRHGRGLDHPRDRPPEVNQERLQSALVLFLERIGAVFRQSCRRLGRGEAGVQINAQLGERCGDSWFGRDSGGHTTLYAANRHGGKNLAATRPICQPPITHRKTLAFPSSEAHTYGGRLWLPWPSTIPTRSKTSRPPWPRRSISSSRPDDLAFEFGAASHTGLRRSDNQDHYLVLRRTRTQQLLLTNVPTEQLSLPTDEAYGMAVADGMGGSGCGALASQLAIRTGLGTRRADHQLGHEARAT